MKKRLYSLTLSIVMVLSLLGSVPAYAEDNIAVLINGSEVKFDVAPTLINNRTMVPLRAIFEALGAAVEWNGDTQTVKRQKKILQSN